MDEWTAALQRWRVQRRAVEELEVGREPRLLDIMCIIGAWRSGAWRGGPRGVGVVDSQASWHFSQPSWHQWAGCCGARWAVRPTGCARLRRGCVRRSLSFPRVRCVGIPHLGRLSCPEVLMVWTANCYFCDVREPRRLLDVPGSIVAATQLADSCAPPASEACGVHQPRSRPRRRGRRATREWLGSVF